MILRHPQNKGAETISPTPLSIPSIYPQHARYFPASHQLEKLMGRAFYLIVESSGTFSERDYLTCRYGNSVWYKDHTTWFFSQADFSRPRVFDLESDPIAPRTSPKEPQNRIERAKTRILEDASGEIPIYQRRNLLTPSGDRNLRYNKRSLPSQIQFVYKFSLQGCRTYLYPLSGVIGLGARPSTFGHVCVISF